MMKINNKKGFSMTTWVFGIVIILTFFVILQTSVLDEMNDRYDKNYSTGIDTSALDSFQSMRQSSDTNIGGGEVSQTAYGLSLTSTWAIAKTIYSTIIAFFNGNFFNTLFTEQLNFPPLIAIVLTLLAWVSLIMVIVYLFMRVKV